MKAKEILYQNGWILAVVRDLALFRPGSLTEVAKGRDEPMQTIVGELKTGGRATYAFAYDRRYYDLEAVRRELSLMRTPIDLEAAEKAETGVRSCSMCGSAMVLTEVDIALMDGSVVLRRVQAFHCPVCQHDELSPVGRSQVAAVDAALEGRRLLELV